MKRQAGKKTFSSNITLAGPLLIRSPSIDSHTDALIRQLIVTEFQHHTIIWVAHRLESVLEFERVVMLENGSLVEDGNPKELMAAGQTKFSELWKASRR